MFKNISKAIWFVWIPVLVLAGSAVYMLAIGIIAAHYLCATLIMWMLVCGLGAEVGYHRVFSHRTHHLPAWKENIILFFAVFSGQGSSIMWTALHRGYHHSHCDTKRDIHSPVAHGFFHAFVGWYFQITQNNMMINIRYAVDLLRKPNHVWFHRNQLKIMWLVPLIVCVVDWRLAFTGFFLVTGISFFHANITNTVGHIRSGIGYRNFETQDRTYNNILTGYLTWGEGWHNNHHHCPGNYDFGSGISGRWWEFDACRIFLPFLKL